MRKKYAPEHVMIRDGVYYYVRHIPCDLAPIYSVTRLCFSLKTKSLKAAIRTSKSVTQRLEDYWLGLRLQNMDIPAIQVVRASDEANDATLCLSEAYELYLRLKGVGKDIATHAWASATYADIYIPVLLHRLGGIAGNHFNQPYRVTDRV